jgi:hypothetical protein
MVEMNIALDDIRSKAPEGATHYVEYHGRLRYIKDDYESSSCFMYEKDENFQYYWFWLPLSIDKIDGLKPL